MDDQFTMLFMDTSACPCQTLDRTDLACIDHLAKIASIPYTPTLEYRDVNPMPNGKNQKAEWFKNGRENYIDCLGMSDQWKLDPSLAGNDEHVIINDAKCGVSYYAGRGTELKDNKAAVKDATSDLAILFGGNTNITNTSRYNRETNALGKYLTNGAIQFPDNVTAVGHSLGGRLVMELSEEFPTIKSAAFAPGSSPISWFSDVGVKGKDRSDMKKRRTVYLTTTEGGVGLDMISNTTNDAAKYVNVPTQNPTASAWDVFVPGGEYHSITGFMSDRAAADF